MGYEDYTVGRFREDTGIAVPLHAKDPARFGKRYEWLMANAKQEWIDWRCGQYTKLFRTFRDRLVAARPDLELYLCLREPQAARIHFFEEVHNDELMRAYRVTLHLPSAARKVRPGRL